MLGMIIKKNKSILHLNLDAIGLNEAMICMIGKFMRRAKSLLAIHLSFNLGATQKAIATLEDTLHAARSFEHEH